jgi:2-oxo-4-hydroxy-4-carboxy-5-ureidoimidazoline decarboxylase
LRAALLDVCASRRWADLVAAAAPYHDVVGLRRAADVALAALDEADVDEALAGHPRIGERADDPSARREQAGVDDATRDALLAANREYEARFGHVYLVRASGRTGEDLLALLRQRLTNDPVQERAVVRAELGQINALRLERLATEEAR